MVGCEQLQSDKEQRIHTECCISRQPASCRGLTGKELSLGGRKAEQEQQGPGSAIWELQRRGRALGCGNGAMEVAECCRYVAWQARADTCRIPECSIHVWKRMVKTYKSQS